ncbi:MAG: D-alanyl-D-alanine carboxypeptidase [Coriobacteriia bacterium]|nr:D-alanyl-D-alanine carboxypeptidase [Coriobacteriia bacterium]
MRIFTKPCTPTRPSGFLWTALIVLVLLSPVVSAVAKPRSSDLVDGRTAAARGLAIGALPDVSMEAGLLSDADGRVLWSRRAGERRSMASITKIMTAIVVLEKAKLDEVVTVPREAASVGQSTAYLVPGEKLTVSELLQAMLVKSGNDAATALALHVGGSEDEFVVLMNRKARELGMKSTHFENPHGLDASGHYSTAADLALMARYAMDKPEFRRIVRQKKAVIGRRGYKHRLESTDLLLGNYRGAIGIKTGNTDSAGYSVVSAAVRNGVLLYGVVLGTDSDQMRFQDARNLLDWGFAHYRPQELATAGTVVGEAPVSNYLDVAVAAAISEDSSATVLDLNGPILRTVTIASVRAPVHVGDRVGAVTFTQDGRQIAGLPLVATQDVGRPNPFQWAWTGIVRGWRAVFG